MHIRDYALAQRYRNPRSNGVLLCSICIRFVPNSPICNNEIGLKPQLRALFLQNKGAFLSNKHVQAESPQPSTPPLIHLPTATYL